MSDELQNFLLSSKKEVSSYTKPKYNITGEKKEPNSTQKWEPAVKFIFFFSSYHSRPFWTMLVNI